MPIGKGQSHVGKGTYQPKSESDAAAIRTAINVLYKCQTHHGADKAVEKQRAEASPA
jgi:hypothetical protein